MPGSPQHTESRFSLSTEELEENVSGNLALGCSGPSSKQSTGHMPSSVLSSRHNGGASSVTHDIGGKEQEGKEDENDDEEIGRARLKGLNAIPDDMAE